MLWAHLVIVGCEQQLSDLWRTGLRRVWIPIDHFAIGWETPHLLLLSLHVFIISVLRRSQASKTKLALQNGQQDSIVWHYCKGTLFPDSYTSRHFKNKDVILIFASLTNDKYVESKKAERTETESRIITSRRLKSCRGEGLVKVSKTTVR